MGFRKKGIPYGFVYDSITKEPISRAIIRIYDSKEMLVWTDVTDAFGSFNAELSKGKYKLFVKKAGYSYPSTLIKGLVDYPLEPIYKGDYVRSMNKGEFSVIIPLDPINIKKRVALGVSARSSVGVLLKLLHIAVFVVGVTFALYTYAKFPSYINLGILILYVPAIITLLSSLFVRRSDYGVVRDMNGSPIANIEVALKELRFDRYIGKRISDENGKYRFVAYQGTYELVVVSDEYRAVRFEGGSSVIHVAKKGSKIVAKNITVKRK